MSKVIKLSDYTSLSNEFIETCRTSITTLEGFTDRYVKCQKLEPFEQLNELELLKREHGAYMSYFLRYYTQVCMYRENGEFLASERKALKSECIEELINEGKSATNADKIVYNVPKYKESMVDIQSIKKFLIYVYETYDQHKTMISRNIHQSISVLQKELETLKRTQI